MLGMAARMRSGAVPSTPPPPEPLMDAYQFPLSNTASDLPERLDCERAEQQQAAKWAKWHRQRKLPPKDTLKKLCRKGIPAQYRSWAWPEISGAADRRAEHMGNYYEAMVNMGTASSEFSHQIELDLPRTFPSNLWMKGEEGQAALRRVLLAFSVHNHEVGYCQSMNYIAALLLLAMDRDEEKTFWVLVSLIDDGGILYQDMYAKNLKGCHVEMRSLEELLSVKLPRLYAHFKSQGCEMSLIATDWFLCLFCTTLPAETTARVWDALLFEGTKILYRVALALLQTQEEVLLAQDNPGYILRSCKLHANGMHDRDRLMKVAFDGIGSLPMAKIVEYRVVKQEDVDFEMRKRENRQLVQSNSPPRASLKQPSAPHHGVDGLTSLAGRMRISYWRGASTTSSSSTAT